jgi:hypothetical protein
MACSTAKMICHLYYKRNERNARTSHVKKYFTQPYQTKNPAMRDFLFLGYGNKPEMNNFVIK